MFGEQMAVRNSAGNATYLLPSKPHKVSYARFAPGEPCLRFRRAVFILYKLRAAPHFVLSRRLYSKTACAGKAHAK